MKKKEWRRALAYLYDEHVGPCLSRWRHRHPFEHHLLQELAEAVDVMRFADRHGDMSMDERGSPHEYRSTVRDVG